VSAVSEAVYAYLDRLGITYRTARHEAAFTMADCARVDAALHSLTVKNIFLTTKNSKRFYLCITRPEARFRTADISKQAGSSRLSFAPEERLTALLRCHAGSASPLGLIFDEDHAVSLLADSALRDAPVLSFHPCDNTQTVAMASGDFFGVFLPSLGVQPRWVEIHDFLTDGEES